MTSDRSTSASKATSSTPWRAACSAVTNGSEARTVISIATARAAIACPILPRPTIPSVLPRSSMPVNWARFHSPRRTDASAAAIRRATPESRASVCSAAAIVLPVGALTTVMPAARRGVEVDVVDADAGPADDLEPAAGRGDHVAIDLDLAPDDERVVAGQDRAELVPGDARDARRPRAPSRSLAIPSAAIGSATRTLTPGRRRGSRSRPGPRRRAPRPGRPPRPGPARPDGPPRARPAPGPR